MSQVTDPVMLDSTGQIIVSKLQDVIDAINGGTIDPLTVTQNGAYVPSGGTRGYGPVTVDVRGGAVVLSGPTAPASSQGEDGDIYLQYYQNELPSGYTPLEFIQNQTSGAYIDTDYLFKTNSILEMDCQLLSASSTYPTPFGTRVNMANDPHQWYLSQGSNRIYYAMGASEYQNTGKSITYGQKVKIVAQREGATIHTPYGNVAVITNSPTNDGTYPLFLGTANLAGSPWTSGWSTLQIYGCKIYEGSTLVRDFRPALNASDIAGLYDLIGNQFYPSSGSISYSAGNAYTDGAVTNAYAKVSGVWQDLTGTDINDINLGS